MMQKRAWLRFFSMASIIIVILSYVLVAQSADKKKTVLILYSYNPEMMWVRNVDAGIRSAFRAEDTIEFYTEYMDTAHNSGPEYIRKLVDIYQYKYSNKKFDLVLTVDDDAYDFAGSYRAALFPGAPVVFCGVNRELAALTQFTGVLETVDIGPTIEAALALQPSVQKIVVINDSTVVGVHLKAAMEELQPQFTRRGFTFEWLEDADLPYLQRQVAELRQDSIVLLLALRPDKADNAWSYEKISSLLAQSSAVPVYGIWDFYMGNGVTGGRITSGFRQGELAGGIGRRILQGEAPASIAVMAESPPQYVFDYTALQRFGLNPARLPEGSEIINQPVADRNGQLAWGAGLFIAVLMLAICLLYVNIARRKKVERELQFIASTDTMTGVLNRRAGMLFLEEQLAMADRLGQCCTVCFVDVNDLKLVNDTCGHDQGDKLITEVGRLLKEPLRSADVLCRLGGDEFLIVFPHCNKEQARMIWQRIAENIARYNKHNSALFSVSVSRGFAEYTPGCRISVRDLVREADQNMYKQKYTLKHTKNGRQ